LGNDVGMIEALCTLGWVQQQLGNPALAIIHYREALKISQASGTQMYAGLALLGIGKAQAELGQTDEAVSVYQQALMLQQEPGQQAWALETTAELAQLALEQGRLADALASVEEIVSVLNASTLHAAYEPLRVYLICYQVLQANHDPRAEQLLAEAYQRL